MTMFERYAIEKVKEANVKNAKEAAIKIKEARLSGEKAGKERVVDELIRRLLNSKQFSLKIIAELTGASIKRVKAVKAAI